MFKLVRNLIAAVLAVAICLFSVLAVGQLVPNQYINAYTGALADKYDLLNVPDREPSIILVGGSNLGFGVNCEKISKHLGMNVINAGLHAGLCRDFQLNLIKTNIVKGDIIVLCFEYTAFADKNMTPSTTWYAIDGYPRLIRLLPQNEVFNLVRYYPLYFLMKVKDAIFNPYPEPSGEAYYRKYFNEYGDLIYPRSENTRKPEEIERNINIDKTIVSEKAIESLKTFKKFCHEKGAEVYFSSPSIDELSVITSPTDIKEFEEYLELSTDIKRISDTEEYILKTEYFYDTYYHLNDKGVDVRTELLINDLEKITR